MFFFFFCLSRLSTGKKKTHKNLEKIIVKNIPQTTLIHIFNLTQTLALLRYLQPSSLTSLLSSQNLNFLLLFYHFEFPNKIVVFVVKEVRFKDLLAHSSNNKLYNCFFFIFFQFQISYPLTSSSIFLKSNDILLRFAYNVYDNASIFFCINKSYICVV